MGFRIEETFRIEAPLDRVWKYIIDPHRVVRCLPGAELTGEEAERTYLGRVKVKVGPVTASYAGRAQLAEVDEARHSVRLTGEGRESGGAGSAKLVMTSRIMTLPDGATEIRVEAEIDVAGKIVQFGRGMIEGVSRQLFKQFADCVRAELATPVSVAQPAASSTVSAAPPAAAPPAAHTSVKPVSALPLVFKWLWSALLDLIRRLSPRRPAR
jgi:carbon monoxide dehydrogenase subunit G